MDLDTNAKKLIIESKRELIIKIFCTVLSLAILALLVGSNVYAKANEQISVNEQIEEFENNSN